MELGIEPRALHMLDKCSTTELYIQSLFLFFGTVMSELGKRDQGMDHDFSSFLSLTPTLEYS